MNEYIKIFKALSDKTRLRILRVLLEANTKLCVCEITDSLQIPYYNVSRHLKELLNANLICEEKEGTFVMYSILNKKNGFTEKIIDLVKTIPEDEFKNDIALLKERLSLRVDGKCVIGLNKKGDR
ncbi:MAG TPA: metalloregulator ArsR/SmtB family transcription factor [Spirochaetota bacterium]|nr:metalloregulator ArsR/SmtB family transcription factor [Spirochaetota bacterium]HOL57030.1 metalloregulator ArsR/SmtB family transcription factor [Spirochaetota bacterium]HPP04609.1 metalloregulator ArsR/SmtB family transcription factor [Spirochaetota bacterium]